jgi:hypothetical protein
MSPSILRALLATLLVPALTVAQFAMAPQVDDQALQEALSLSDWNLQELSLPDQPGLPFTVTVRLADQDTELLLQPHSMRSPDFQLLVQTADGSIVEQLPAAPATYRGLVVGWPESVVAGSLIDGQLTAFVRLAPHLPVHGVQPLSAVQPGAARRVHVVYDGSDVLSMDVTCGTDESWRPQPQQEDGWSGAADGTSNKLCQIACDADVEFYGKNQSSVPNTQADIENVLNAVETIYKNDVGIEYEITTILVRTSEPDPYSSSNSGTLLNQFKNYWNSNHQSIQRDVAHLFTGKNIDGSVIGIAYLSVICNLGSAYGLSQSRYTTNFTARTALTAHELGHNWSASHCDGQGDCKIMCSGLGGCGPITSFGTSAKNSINNKKNSVGCLSNVVPPAPPTITSLNPGSVAALGTTAVTINGSGFEEVLKVTVGGVDVLVGNGVTVNSLTQLTFGPPAPAALGSQPVTVTNSGGTSNALTLTYVETNPPLLQADFIGTTS